MKQQFAYRIPELRIDVVEDHQRARRGRDSLHISDHLTFSTAGLQSYAFARWEPVIYDAVVVAAAVEYGDRITKRAPLGWPRRIELRIPVHDPRRWQEPAVSEALLDALGFLTGDNWTIEFVPRAAAANVNFQHYLDLGGTTAAVLAFSDGLDSRAVAGLLAEAMGDKLVRVRVGPKSHDRPKSRGKPQPFASVPYELRLPAGGKESSARSRGFKFALVSGIAAYLAEASEIVIPESGQGALGPVLIPVAHAYRDYRNHPLFTRRMEKFLRALFGHDVTFSFPRIWNTKGETLRDYVSAVGGTEWATTRSCWRNSQWSSVSGKRRQCGVCAACMLRRLSVHAAGLTEAPDTYIAEDLTARTLEEGVNASFSKANHAFRQYALAGVLHMDHLAGMSSSEATGVVNRHGLLIAPALGLPPADAADRYRGLLARHAAEWASFVRSQGEHSFLRGWLRNDYV